MPPHQTQRLRLRERPARQALQVRLHLGHQLSEPLPRLLRLRKLRLQPLPAR